MTRNETIAYGKDYYRDLTTACCEIDEKHKEFVRTSLEALEQEPKWILTSKKLPNIGQWVLVTTKDYQKLVEIKCYQGIQVGRHNIGNGWEEYEYPSWTSGHGDIQDSHPIAWMPLPHPYEPQEISDRNLKMWHDIFEEEKRRMKGSDKE